MLLQVFFAIIFECLSSNDAKVTFMLITNFSQGRYNILQYGVIFNDNININDRFCRQTLHRSTADMFNSYGQLPQSIGKFGFYSKEILSPLFIVWQDNNMLRNHSILSLQIPISNI